MAKFIRIDRKGHWRETEHISSMCGLGDEMYFEEGISCYILDDIGYALEKLRQYWHNVACFRHASEFADFQITIFEGELLDAKGSDYEDLATCERTLYELNAEKIMSVLYDLYEKFEYEESLTEDEYFKSLEKIIA